jgi:hypothetical protein
MPPRVISVPSRFAIVAARAVFSALNPALLASFSEADAAVENPSMGAPVIPARFRPTAAIVEVFPLPADPWTVPNRCEYVV